MPSDNARVAAAIEILNHGYGRPQQSVEVIGRSHLEAEFNLTREALMEELRRRGLPPVLQLMARNYEEAEEDIEKTDGPEPDSRH